MIRPELLLLKYLLDYELYSKYRSYIKDIEEKELQTLYSILDKLMTKQTSITFEEYSLYVLTNAPFQKDILQNLLDTLQKTQVENTFLIEILEQYRERSIAHQVALAAINVTNGKQSLAQVKSLLDEAPDDIEDVDDFPFVDDNLENLHENHVKKRGLRWRLKTLNRVLGSLRIGNFGFIFARPESYSSDTEVLTPGGWLTVDKVTLNTEIAQVDSNLSLSFVYPSAVHPHEQDYCYHIHDTLGRVDLIVTEGHGMVIEKNGVLQKERADSIVYQQGVKHHVAAKTSSQSRDLNDMERLAIAYQADGHTRNYKEYGYTFSFKKKRKIERLKVILDSLGWKYATYKDGNLGHIGFYVKTLRPLVKDFSWVDLDCKSTEWCQQFIEELSYWDSTRRTDTRFKFDTTNKAVADIVQAIAIMAGYNCLMSNFVDNRKETYRDVYSLNIRTNYKPVDGQCIKKDRIPFTATTYCFEVPTGMLLVRRKGAVAVCGNTGKTTFLASESSFMAEQLAKDDGPILWFNNEEDGKTVQLRVIQASLGCDLQTLFSNLAANKEKYNTLTKNKIKIIDSAVVSKQDVEKYCKKFHPSLIIFDQLDKVKGFDKDARDDLRLGYIYQWARELAKTYCPVIAVCQADGSGEGKKWLTMENVANAKTAKQAEADWILGIGCSHQDGFEYIRHLHASKNKLPGDEDSDPLLRHGKVDCIIEPIICRYKDFD